MKLQIKKDALLRDIQKDFNRHFPFLRIAFFKLPHTDRELSPQNEELQRFTAVSELVKWTEDKVMEIDEEMTIGQFELTMKQIGLFVQVFRKSGRVWIETSYTDDWSLQKQNEEGKMMSSIHDAESEKQNDWDDWD